MALNDAKQFIQQKDLSEHMHLKPCPFCGSEEVVYYKYDHQVGERYGVVCLNCIAEIDPGYAQSMGTVQDMWNRRA